MVNAKPLPFISQTYSVSKNNADRVETDNVRLPPTFISMTAFLPAIAVPSRASVPLPAGETRDRGSPSWPPQGSRINARLAAGFTHAKTEDENDTKPRNFTAR